MSGSILSKRRLRLLGRERRRKAKIKTRIKVKGSWRGGVAWSIGYLPYGFPMRIRKGV
jgi:hypothetical protein